MRSKFVKLIETEESTAKGIQLNISAFERLGKLISGATSLLPASSIGSAGGGSYNAPGGPGRVIRPSRAVWSEVKQMDARALEVIAQKLAAEAIARKLADQKDLEHGGQLINKPKPKKKPSILLGSIMYEDPKLRLLQSLSKELSDLINGDIMPRWKRREDVIERFLNNIDPSIPVEDAKDSENDIHRHSSLSSMLMKGIIRLSARERYSISAGVRKGITILS
jgi:hypothetical protein